MDKKVLWPLTVVFGVITGFSAGTLLSPGKELSRSALEKSQRMESLSISLGQILEGERSVRQGLEEHIGELSRNLFAASRTAIEFEIKFSDLSIRYREVEDALADIGIELNAATGDISRVADDISSFIEGVEDGSATPAP
jgi:hypothetical protein